MEIFETKAHREAEEAENAKQSESLHIDVGRFFLQSIKNETGWTIDPTFTPTAANMNRTTPLKSKPLQTECKILEGIRGWALTKTRTRCA